MTLLFFDGFQDAATTRKPEWDVVGAFISQIGRDASTNGAASISSINQKILTLPSSASTVVCGCGFFPNTSSIFGSSSLIVGFGAGSAAGTAMTMIGVNSSGLLEARWGANNASYLVGTLIGTATHTPLTGSVWRHLQVKLLPHTSAGTLELLLDGVSVLSVSGVKTNNSTSAITHVIVNGTSTNSGANSAIYWDDMYVCDTTDATSTQGRANNDYLGDLKVATLIPSANGDLTAWAKSTGTNAAALVDEVPPNTTDYISTSTAAARELMAIPDLAAAGAVYGVRLNHYSLKTDAGASSVKPLLKETGGTITAQTAQALSTTAAPYAGPFLFTKPSAPTTPWTPSDINALQIGVELA